MARTVRVDLGPRSYDVRIGLGLLGQVGAAVAGLRDVTSAAVITDENVAGLYARRVAESLAGANLAAPVISFPPGEPSKTLATYGTLMDRLFALKPAVDRGCVIVALGGGVPGDLAGFVAATALRGLRFVQCPTTLLADVDSSVGGKTGVDHPAGKNLIGAFHQPRAVLIDVDALRTLPAAELASGLAECVKHAAIRDPGMLDFIERHVEAILAREAEAMTDLIARNVEIKAAVVSADEREAGQRAHLNFGHTIGHAIEAVSGYGVVSHGQAVALGMVAANRLAGSRGLLGEAEAGRVESLLSRLGLPTARAGLDADEVWRAMQHDKKARGGRVRMVLLTGLGSPAVCDDVTAREVHLAVEALTGS